MYRAYLCSRWVWVTIVPLPHNVPSPKCWGSERLNSSNNGFPSQDHLVKRCVTPICPGQFAFIPLLSLIDVASSSFPFLRGGSGLWPHEDTIYRKVIQCLLFAAWTIFRETSRGSLVRPQASTHHLPQLIHAQLCIGNSPLYGLT